MYLTLLLPESPTIQKKKKKKLIAKAVFDGGRSGDRIPQAVAVGGGAYGGSAMTGLVFLEGVFNCAMICVAMALLVGMTQCVLGDWVSHSNHMYKKCPEKAPHCFPEIPSRILWRYATYASPC